MYQEDWEVTNQSSSRGRNIQPGQQKPKGVARMVNGPKKNIKWSVIKRRNKQQETLPPQTPDISKDANVYDRLYNSRSIKESKRVEDNK
jgi:hypothetical protein